MQVNETTGQSYPLGATVFNEGVNFSFFSKNAEAVDLLLFSSPDAQKPSKIISLDPQNNRTYYYWHVFVPGITAGQLYGYRVYGPYDPKRGLRFDGWKLLLDPYTAAVAGSQIYSRDAAKLPGNNMGQALKSVVVDTDRYDWEGDTPLNIPFATSVIYELHVKGFTMHPNSGVSPEKRGTYAGLIEKIPYLQSLGITAVELMPVHHFDPYDAPSGRLNYWGYSPMAFFAPHTGYCYAQDPLDQLNEFRDMVKAFHKAGIEVILDVVFNHTAEGDHTGPTFSFKGFENKAYYMLDDNKDQYKNYTGCGNTLNSNHSVIRRMIMDCLRRWVLEMHVDGFRFDLASILSRSEDGKPLENPPILWEIESDPVLAHTKIIAEAWDAAGLYQVGSFPGDKWAEWNGRFRDDVRRFLRGEPDTVYPVSRRILGSPDIYPKGARSPARSINFITCHDGFTLNDLVSYNYKHNELNGEYNNDGSNDNHSWNCGVEGETNDPEIEKLRLRQIKNGLSLLLLSHGTPMLSMGDEVRRTQSGNNNAYCQDNEMSWFDWSLVEKNQGLLRFTRMLIAFIQQYEPYFQKTHWNEGYTHETYSIDWHGIHLGKPDWGKNSHSLAFTLHNAHMEERLHLMINSWWEPLEFLLPPLPEGGSTHWRKILDTFEDSPKDFVVIQDAMLMGEDSVLLPPRTIVGLYAV